MLSDVFWGCASWKYRAMYRGEVCERTGVRGKRREWEYKWESTPELYIPVWLNFPLLTGQAFFFKWLPVPGCMCACVRACVLARVRQPVRQLVIFAGSPSRKKEKCQNLFTVSSLWRDRRHADCQRGFGGAFTARTTANLSVFIQLETEMEGKEARRASGVGWCLLFKLLTLLSSFF